MLTIVLNAMALASPVLDVLLPYTVFCAMSGKSAKSTALAARVTQPSVTLKSSLSKLARPKSACVIPVAFALVVAAVIASLLWVIAALALTSELIILPLVIAVVAILPVTVKVTSPASVALS